MATSDVDRAIRNRRIINLSISGASREEIAEITGLSAVTVKDIQDRNKTEILTALRASTDGIKKSIAQYQAEAMEKGAEFAPDAMDILITVAQNSPSDSLKVRAATEILDRVGLNPRNAPSGEIIPVEPMLTEEMASVLLEAFKTLPEPAKQLSRGDIEGFKELVTHRRLGRGKDKIIDVEAITVQTEKGEDQ